MPYDFSKQQPIALTDPEMLLGSTTTDKIDNLQSKKQQKLDKLNPDPTTDMYNDMNITEGKYGITQDSLNNYTPAQLQEMLGASVNDRVYYDDANTGPYQMRQDKNGNWNKVAYNDYTQHLYIAPSKDGNMKLGLAGAGFKERYTPGLAAKEGLTTNKKYGWAPGKKGVDPTKDPYLDIALPYDEAAKLEFLTHSNKGQVANRAGGYKISDFMRKRTDDIYGAGASEYTTQNAPMWNINSVNTDINGTVVTPKKPRLLNEIDTEALNASADKYDSDRYIGELTDELQGSMYNILARATNAMEDSIKGTALGDDALESFNSKVKQSDSFDIYNKRKYLQDIDNALKYAGVKGSTIKEYKKTMNKAKKEFNNGNYLSSFSTGLTILPEIFAQSGGEILAMRLPGGILALSAIRAKEYNDTYKKNNGKGMSDLKLAETFVEQVATLGLDKFAIKAGLEDILKPTKGLISKVIDVLKSSGLEGLQEYLEGVTEDWATQKEDNKTIGEIATSDKNKFSGFLGMTMGAGAKVGGMAVAGVTPTRLLPKRNDTSDNRETPENDIDSDSYNTETPKNETDSDSGNPDTHENKTAGYNPETFVPLDEHLKVVGNNDVLKALEAHKKAVSEGQVYTGEDTHPVLDEESLAYVHDHYTKAINITENIINGINSKMNSGKFTEQDAADLDAAENLLVDLQAGKTRYFGEGQVLNNRSIKDIDKDIADISGKDNLNSDDKYKLGVLAVERQIAEKLQTAGIIDNEAVDLKDADTAKASEVLQMKIYGGISTDGKLKTGLMDYARILLNPNTNEATKKATLKSLNRFMKSQSDKAYALEKARSEYMINKAPATVTYGNNKTKFTYHGPQSDKAVDAVINERDVLQDVADQLRLGEVEIPDTEVQKNKQAWYSTNFDVNSRIGRKIAKSILTNVTPKSGKQITEEMKQKFLAKNPKLVDSVKQELASAKRKSNSENDTSTNNETQQNKQETDNGQQDEADIGEGTKGNETTEQRRKSTKEPVNKNERPLEETATKVVDTKVEIDSLLTEINQLVNELGKLSKTDAWRIDELKNKADKYYELYKLVDKKTKGRLTRAMNKSFGKGTVSRGKIKPRQSEPVQKTQHKTNGKKAPPDSSESSDVVSDGKVFDNAEPTPLSVIERSAEELRTSEYKLNTAKGAKANKLAAKAENARKIIDSQLEYLYKARKFKALAKAISTLGDVKTPVSNAMKKVVNLQRKLADKTKDVITADNMEEIVQVKKELDKVREVYAGVDNTVGNTIIKQNGKGEETLKEAVIKLVKTNSKNDIIATTLRKITGCK